MLRVAKYVAGVCVVLASVIGAYGLSKHNDKTPVASIPAINSTSNQRNNTATTDLRLMVKTDRAYNLSDASKLLPFKYRLPKLPQEYRILDVQATYTKFDTYNNPGWDGKLSIDYVSEHDNQKRIFYDAEVISTHDLTLDGPGVERNVNGVTVKANEFQHYGSYWFKIDGVLYDLLIPLPDNNPWDSTAMSILHSMIQQN